MAANRLSCTAASLACALVATSTVLTGCLAPSTPLCDQAAALARQSKLSAAAEAYAQAARRNEGQCAKEGSVAVAKTQAEALTEVARGQAAEKAGDLSIARAAYQAAIALDAGSGDAIAGLARVTRRPSTVNSIWLRAQRLHDEGYDQAARTEIISVLKAHPDQVIPQSLARLSSAASPTTAARHAVTSPASRAQATTSTDSPEPVSRWLLALVSAAVLAIAVASAGALQGWRRLRRRLVTLASENAQARTELARARAELALLTTQAETLAGDSRSHQERLAEHQRLLTALQHASASLISSTNSLQRSHQQQATALGRTLSAITALSPPGGSPSTIDYSPRG